MEFSAPVTAAEIDEAVCGLTVPRLFAAQVAARPDAPAIRWKEGDGWEGWTWREYADQVARAAGGFQRLGLGQHDRAVLMLRNGREFHVADTALSHLGACPVSIYNSSSTEQVQFLARHCRARLAVVEDEGFLQRVLAVRHELPDLEHVVVVRPPAGGGPDGVLLWDDVLAGEAADLTTLVDVAQPDDLATLIYTSGTTGPPKAVMISHSNVVWTLESLLYAIAQPVEGWRQVSYLPMAHIAERMVSHYIPMRGGQVVHCCPDAGKIGAYLGEVHPTLLFGVPRVYEKIHAGVLAFVAGEQDPERKAGMEEALAVGRQVAELTLAGDEVPTGLAARHAELDAAILATARALVGLDEAKVVVSGAAPVSAEVLWFFRSIGVPIAEIYGQSESTGPLTWDPYQPRIGTVGRPIPGCTVRLNDEDGEVLFRGGNVFLGYLDAPDKTAEVLDDEGWVHTGDVGQFDADGYLSIVDRKKELIITAGGKNVSPANIESLLKSHPLISQAAVIGDRRKFLSALIVLDPDVTPGWARAQGIETPSLAELSRHPVVHAEIERNVAAVNAQLSKTEGVKRFTVLPDEWLPDSEELTPTMKLKRRGIASRYGAEIEAMYAD